jgi:hypothetical protein
MAERLAVGSGRSGTIIEGKFFTANYGDATPITVWQMSFNRRLLRITIETSLLWDGIGANITLGTNLVPDKYFNIEETDLTSLGYYDKEFSESGPVDFELTINAGIGSTSGQINIIFETISI